MQNPISNYTRGKSQVLSVFVIGLLFFGMAGAALAKSSNRTSLRSGNPPAEFSKGGDNNDHKGDHDKNHDDKNHEDKNHEDKNHEDKNHEDNDSGDQSHHDQNSDDKGNDDTDQHEDNHEDNHDDDDVQRPTATATPVASSPLAPVKPPTKLGHGQTASPTNTPVAKATPRPTVTVTPSATATTTPTK